jgi:hypothetical protein
MHRGVRRKSLYPWVRLTRNSLLNQVRQSIVHVLDEWAKVARDTAGTSNASLPEHLGSGLLHRLTSLLSTYAEDEWLRHTNLAKSEWRILRVSGPAWRMGILHGVNFWPLGD